MNTPIKHLGLVTVLTLNFGLALTACQPEDINGPIEPNVRIDFISPRNLVASSNDNAKIQVFGKNFGSNPTITLTSADKSYSVQCTTVSESLPGENSQATCTIPMTKGYVGKVSLRVSTSSNNSAQAWFAFVSPETSNSAPVIDSFRVTQDPESHHYQLSVKARDNSAIEWVQFFVGSTAAQKGDPFIGKGIYNEISDEWTFDWADPTQLGLSGKIYIYAWVTDDAKWRGGTDVEGISTQSKIMQIDLGPVQDKPTN